jgi:hypothetical protein
MVLDMSLLLNSIVPLQRLLNYRSRDMFKKIALTTILLLAILPWLFSQPGDPQRDVDNPVPIAGIQILLIAGMVLGIVKLITRMRASPARKDDV